MILRLRADAVKIPLADGTAHMVCTSPPYYGLRKYAGVPETVWGGDSAHVHRWGKEQPPIKGDQGPQTKWASVSAVADGQRASTGAFCACGAWRGCLGNEPTPDLFVSHLVECFREVRRVLRDDGTCWVVLGDSFSGGGNGGIPAGNLLGVPWRVALALQADGWVLRNDVSWCKRATMPESLRGWAWERHRIRTANAVARSEPSRIGTWPDKPNQGHARGENHAEFAPRAEWADCPGCPTCAPNDGLVLRRGSWRHTRAHEVVLMLAKSMGYWSDAQAVAEVAVHAGRIVKASGNGAKNAAHEAENDARTAGGFTRRDTVVTTRNPRSYMLLGPEPLREAHYAAFPAALVEPLLLATCPERVCSRCGAPWARIVERDHKTALKDAPTARLAVRDRDAAVAYLAAKRTLGHRPTCACAAATRPSVILDPFAGSGTVARVAIKHRRRAVLCDMSQGYLRDIADGRTRGVQVEGPWNAP